MFDQLYDGVRKVAESALQTQQEMLRQYSQYWPTAHSPIATASEAAADLLRKRWWLALTQTAEEGRDMMERTYASSSALLALSTQLANAKSPEEHRELLMNWWQSLQDAARSQFEAQTRFAQRVVAHWFEVAAQKGATSP